MDAALSSPGSIAYQCNVTVWPVRGLVLHQLTVWMQYVSLTLLITSSTHGEVHATICASYVCCSQGGLEAMLQSADSSLPLELHRCQHYVVFSTGGRGCWQSYQ